MQFNLFLTVWYHSPCSLIDNLQQLILINRLLGLVSGLFQDKLLELYLSSFFTCINQNIPQKAHPGATVYLLFVRGVWRCQWGYHQLKIEERQAKRKNVCQNTTQKLKIEQMYLTDGIAFEIMLYLATYMFVTTYLAKI